MPTGVTTLLLPLLFLVNVLQLNSQQYRWISDTELLNVNEDNIYDTLTGNTTKISSNYTFNFYSRDLRYGALYQMDSESHRAPDLWYFTLNITDIKKHKNYTVGIPTSNRLTSFLWSHGSAYAFVLENDVYYAFSPGKKPIKITNSKKSKTINGELSYMAHGELWEEYAWEEGSLWFSPSDKYLAYSSTPINATKKVLLTTYNRTEKYNYNYEMEYAKTGDEEAATSLSIWSVAEKKPKLMDVQLDSKAFYYLFGVSWIVLHGKELLLATWANRWQNETALTFCTYQSGTCEMFFEHKYNHTQWASPVDYTRIVHSDSAIFILLPEVMSDNAWQHVAKIEISANFAVDSVSFLPSGNYDVRRILAYRPAENIVIYDAQAPHPWNRHFYGTPAGENSIFDKDRCLTCFSPNCTFQQLAVVSPFEELKMAFWCSGPSPKHRVMVAFNATLDVDDTHIIIAPKETEKEMPEMTTETILLSNGYEAIVRIYHGNTTLDSVPVTLLVYGGPMDFNKVTDEYINKPRPIGYQHAIVYIDVRGSAGRGWNYKSAIYGRLVTVEVEDTLEAMKLVLEKYPRLDKTRVGVYGGSYGGTMSIALVELAPPSFFKCAISMCPVTNFVYYKAWYTERFMTDTAHSSYTDLSLNVTAFNSTRLLLAHGLRDANVLFQHSALFIEALQLADIPFELMVYPNQNHHIDRGIKKHEGHLTQSFLKKCYE